MTIIKKFFYTKAYLVMLALFTLYVWTTKSEAIFAPIALGLMFLQFLFLKDTIPTAAILLNALFMIGSGYDTWTMATIPLYVYLAPVAVIVGMVAHVIIYKQRLFQGKMLPGILIMVVALIGSSFNAAFVNFNYLFYGVVALFYAFVYFVYVGSFTGKHSDYLMTLFFLLGLVISLEILVYYLRVEDIMLELERGTIHLGWGVSNYVATYLVMFIPATFYYAKKSKYGIFLILVAMLQIVSLLFTSSKAGLISFAIILPMLIIYQLWDHKWYKTLLNLAVLAGSIALVYGPLSEFINTMVTRLWGEGLDDAGRIGIWLEGVAMFRRYPMFGGGIFARFDTAYRMYHNTFLHVMATLGIVGLIGLLHQLYMQFIVLLRNLDRQRIIFIIALLGAHAHGMVDNIYLMPQFMVIIMIIVANFENANKQLLLKEQLVG
jgi:O-antigen ligase